LPNGEKNGLRKTYKGKIKDLGISGKFDVVVREDNAPDGLMAMLRLPEEEFANQYGHGKGIEHGLSKNVLDSLSRAMTMSKGIIPKNQWDSSVLGELDLPEKKIPANPLSSKAATAMGRGLSNPAIQARVGRSEIARPKRNVKKRGYEESSYEGYGEGFVDDELVDAGYSTGEGDDRALSQKRRKKVGSEGKAVSFMTDRYQSGTNHAYPDPMRHNSYGPGMVGA
jgi:hypothetical protein